MNFVPTIIDTLENKEYSSDIFSNLLNKRTIFINGEINDNLSNIVIAELLYLDSNSNEDIKVYINSPGGSVTSGMAIYDVFKSSKSKIITIGLGLCASMGAFLLSSGDKRYSYENTEIMIHEVLGSQQGAATDIKIQTDRLLKVKNKINKILALNTNKSIKEIEKYTNRDYYMNSKEAKSFGIIDEIIKKES